MSRPIASAKQTSSEHVGAGRTRRRHDFVDVSLVAPHGNVSALAETSEQFHIASASAEVWVEYHVEFVEHPSVEQDVAGSTLAPTHPISRRMARPVAESSPANPLGRFG